jgi:alanine dehydrogenase
MIIGVPKEIKEQEQRVALLPSATNELTKHGHSVLVEKGAGLGSGYSDQDYVKAGAEIVEEAKDVFARADMIVKQSSLYCVAAKFFSRICTWRQANLLLRLC